MVYTLVNRSPNVRLCVLVSGSIGWRFNFLYNSTLAHFCGIHEISGRRTTRVFGWALPKQLDDTSSKDGPAHRWRFVRHDTSRYILVDSMLIEAFYPVKGLSAFFWFLTLSILHLDSSSVSCSVSSYRLLQVTVNSSLTFHSRISYLHPLCTTGGDTTEAKYFIPFFDRVVCCLPENVRMMLRCGMEVEDPEELAVSLNLSLLKCVRIV